MAEKKRSIFQLIYIYIIGIYIQLISFLINQRFLITLSEHLNMYIFLYNFFHNIMMGFFSDEANVDHKISMEIDAMLERIQGSP